MSSPTINAKQTLSTQYIEKQPAINLTKIAYELSKTWPHYPLRNTPLPLVWIADTRENPQDPELPALQYDIKGMLLEASVVHEQTGKHLPDTLHVLANLVEEAIDRNLPMILYVTPPLLEDCKTIEQLIAHEVKKAYIKVVSLSIQLLGENQNPAGEFDLMLSPFWSSMNAHHPFISALLLEKMGIQNDTSVPLELTTIKNARNIPHLSVAPQVTEDPPHALEPILSRLIQSTYLRIEKFFPSLYRKITDVYPTIEHQKNYIKLCLLIALEKAPQHLFMPPADDPKLYASEFELLKEEREMNEKLYTALSSDTRELSILVGWYPFNDNRLTVRGERVDPIYATPVRTGIREFIATIGPIYDGEIAYFKKLVAQEEVEVVVSLPQSHEYGDLGREIEEDSFRWVSTTTSSISSTLDLKEFSYLKQQNTKTIKQLRYRAWPDGTAIPPSSLHMLVEEVKRQVNTNRPFIVHCKSGIGRTGTFCAAYEINLLFDQHCKAGKPVEEFQPNIYSLVLQMSLQRPGMVQNLDQYKSLYQYVTFLKQT